jgi:cell division protein FtsZ
MKMKEIEEAASYIQEQAHEDANIIFGAAVDENMGDMMKVTVIATGFDQVVGADAPQSSAVAVRTNPGMQQASPYAQQLQQAPAPSAHAPREPLHAQQTRPSFNNHPSSMRPSAPQMAIGGEPREELPVPTRRPPARELSSGAASHRDRTSFVPPTDSDWDTPAFQRRGH